MTTAIGVGWVCFWAYWLIASLRAKPGTRRGGRFPPGVRIVVAAVVVTRVLAGHNTAIGGPVVGAVGVATFATGLAVAIWARAHLGRNWGMPMTEKEEPELVTSGPYRYVRHPIYTGILLAMLGTALTVDVYWLIPLAVTAAYFVHSARVEEQLMSSSFPGAYPAYRARTKMLIPFVL